MVKQTNGFTLPNVTPTKFTCSIQVTEPVKMSYDFLNGAQLHYCKCSKLYLADQVFTVRKTEETDFITTYHCDEVVVIVPKMQEEIGDVWLFPPAMVEEPLSKQERDVDCCYIITSTDKVFNFDFISFYDEREVGRWIDKTIPNFDQFFLEHEEEFRRIDYNPF